MWVDAHLVFYRLSDNLHTNPNRYTQDIYIFPKAVLRHIRYMWQHSRCTFHILTWKESYHVWRLTIRTAGADTKLLMLLFWYLSSISYAAYTSWFLFPRQCWHFDVSFLLETQSMEEHLKGSWESFFYGVAFLQFNKYHKKRVIQKCC